MTDSNEPAYDEICDDVSGRSRAEGALFAIFLDGSAQVLLTTEVGEGTRHVDELFLRHLVGQVTDMGVAEVIFAVLRAKGRPTRLDRVLFRELQERLRAESCTLRDLVVVGTASYWSAVAARSTARPPVIPRRDRDAG